ncbi:unnamed protein product [Ambrosiozyma monospora]|uniref:Unnamed protein product n=1 Tax=Ambrosiozyma monospora TaxID=43982 RepID=A0ACB5U2E6_AMBMO|nr:unnamed protein product [Ambrosiozyma monospora]
MIKLVTRRLNQLFSKPITTKFRCYAKAVDLSDPKNSGGFGIDQLPPPLSKNKPHHPPTKNIRISQTTKGKILNTLKTPQQLISKDWLKLFFKKNSPEEQQKSIEKIESVFQSFTRPNAIASLKSNMMASFMPGLEQYGDENWKELLLKDKELAQIYKRSLIGCYFQVASELFEQDIDGSDVIEEDTDVCSIYLTEVSLQNAHFNRLINEIRGIDIDSQRKPRIISLVERYMSLPEPRFIKFQPETILSFEQLIQENLNIRECFMASGSLMKDIGYSKRVPLTSAKLQQWMIRFGC